MFRKYIANKRRGRISDIHEGLITAIMPDELKGQVSLMKVVNDTGFYSKDEFESIMTYNPFRLFQTGYHSYAAEAEDVLRCKLEVLKEEYLRYENYIKHLKESDKYYADNADTLDFNIKAVLEYYNGSFFLKYNFEQGSYSDEETFWFIEKSPALLKLVEDKFCTAREVSIDHSPEIKLKDNIAELKKYFIENIFTQKEKACDYVNPNTFLFKEAWTGQKVLTDEIKLLRDYLLDDPEVRTVNILIVGYKYNGDPIYALQVFFFWSHQDYYAVDFKQKHKVHFIE